MKSALSNPLVNLSLLLLMSGCGGILPLPDLLLGRILSRPVADAGPDQSAFVCETVTLSAATSVDRDGGSLSYAWTQTAGPVRVELQGANQRGASFVPPIAGTYDFVLAVTNDVASDEDSVRVSVAARDGDEEPFCPVVGQPVPPADEENLLPWPIYGTDPRISGSEPAPEYGEAPTSGGLLASSNFDVDNEGWRVTGRVDSDIPGWTALDGRPDGAIRAIFKPSGGGSRTGYFIAPAKFLGNMSAAYGGMLQFDSYSVHNYGPRGSWLCVLSGGNGVQVAYEPPDGKVSGWQRFRIPLEPTGGWKRLDTEQVVSEEELLDLLGDLTDLRIRGEYPANSAGQEGRLDNVQIETP